MQPLHGIRVLDLSRVLAGPYCTMVLGDLGADVIKAESPEGDETRGWGPPFAEGESAYYLCVNHNKRSLVVDFKTEEGRAILWRLIRHSDVLVENFRPGTLARYSLDFDSASSLNQSLIYCSITGFGQTGPLRDKPGYDFMIQAMGGLMSFTGEPDGEPMKVGVAVADLFAGQNAVIAILAALQARSHTGRGPIFLKRTAADWLSALESADLPCGPINILDKVFAEPQAAARGMLIHMEHPQIGDLPLVGSPLKFSETSIEYKTPLPGLGEHTDEILRELFR